MGLEKGSGRRWVGLHSEGLHDLGCSQGINWGGQVKQHAIGRARVCRREMRTGSGEKTWSKERTYRPRHRWEYDIKVDLNRLISE